MNKRVDKYFKRVSANKAPWEVNKKPILYALDMELTERCNNNCIHCCINLPEQDADAKKKELSADRIKKILTEAATLGCLTVRFTGGEPLLRDDFEDIYLFARRLGMKVTLFTNATRITPQIAELLSRVPPLELVEVTLYGMKKNSYEAVSRVQGSFEAAWRGTRLLLEKNIPFIVKGARLPPNQHEMTAFRQWAKQLPWMESSPTYAMFFDLRLRKDSAVKNNQIRAMRISPEEGVRYITQGGPQYIAEMKSFAAQFMSVARDRLFSCAAGCRTGCVDSYGKFQLCLMLRHPATVYDLESGSLADAIENFFPKIRTMTADNPDYLGRCARCFLISLCNQCPAKSWIEHDRLDTPVAYWCEAAHLQARFLGLLTDTEKAWEIEDWSSRIERFTGRPPRKHSIAKAQNACA